MGVAENLARVQERIRAACSRAGRDPDTVQLVAVSKGQPIEAVLLAFAAGQSVFGENYAQELHEKADALPVAEWNFIGALQTNKVKIVVGHAALIHTCDRVSLARELAKRAEHSERSPRSRGVVERMDAFTDHKHMRPVVSVTGTPHLRGRERQLLAFQP